MQHSDEVFEMKIELIPLPVSDVERSKTFYSETLGFHLDHDVEPGNGMRIIQFTPPGSACSIVFGTGMGLESAPGSVKGVHLVVKNIEAVRSKLKQNGLEISDVQNMGGVKFAFFEDPDKNSWELQEIGENLTLPE